MNGKLTAKIFQKNVVNRKRGVKMHRKGRVPVAVVAEYEKMRYDGQR